MFGSDNKEKIAYLNEEREKMWKRLTRLEEEREQLFNRLLSVEEGVAKKTSDYEKEAKEASKRTVESKNKAKKVHEESLHVLEEIKSVLEGLNSLKTSAQDLHNETENIKSTANSEYKKFKSTFEKQEGAFQQLEDRLNKVESFFEQHPNLDSQIDNLDVLLTKADENSSKISTVYKNVVSRKGEIDELYNEIIGYSATNEDGKEVPIEGLKDELEKSYSDIREKTELLIERVDEIFEDTSKGLNKFLEEKQLTISTTIESWEKSYQTADKQIKELLPGALTTGLSHAYSDKKIEELKSYSSLTRSFNWGIGGLVAVSCIPFCISIYFLMNGEDLHTVIDRIPKMVIAILPLYLPVLWLAISANKKRNLSKRLIEEYTHKEVLSKTFQGLSTQINSLEENEISNQLKLRLLFNLLEVSSENPGKLISNYDSSDHPLMEVLDQSSKLQGSIEKLEKIPGLDKIVKMLDAKYKRIVEEQGKKVIEGIKVVTEIADDVPPSPF